jgi:putative Mn2+ efflux pump MntP
MSLLSLFVLAVGLSMDAFAVSICKGLAMKKISFKECAIVGLWFGGFQALMPAIGYLLGNRFVKYITAIDHWIAFVLLCLIGINMIREALSKDEEEADASLDVKNMFLMAVATSIDALAVGITFAFLQDVAIIPAVSFIGCTTFVLSAIGVKVGNVFGTKYKSKAELAGGIILVLLGCKILLEHLGIL